jgi:hypothetical protein
MVGKTALKRSLWTLYFMQTRVSDAANPEDSLPSRFPPGPLAKKCYLRWVPHSLTENEAQGRVTFTEELLQVVRPAKVRNFEQ